MTSFEVKHGAIITGIGLEIAQESIQIFVLCALKKKSNGATFSFEIHDAKLPRLRGYVRNIRSDSVEKHFQLWRQNL